MQHKVSWIAGTAPGLAVLYAGIEHWVSWYMTGTTGNWACGVPYGWNTRYAAPQQCVAGRTPGLTVSGWKTGSQGGVCWLEQLKHRVSQCGLAGWNMGLTV